MAGPRKGFTNERHSGLKAAMAAVAVLGFAGGWAGFSNAHSAALDDGAVLTSPTPVSSTPTIPVRTSAPSSPGTMVPTATLSGAPPNPSATRAPRRSRGS